MFLYQNQNTKNAQAQAEALSLQITTNHIISIPRLIWKVSMDIVVF